MIGVRRTGRRWACPIFRPLRHPRVTVYELWLTYIKWLPGTQGARSKCHSPPNRLLLGRAQRRRGAEEKRGNGEWRSGNRANFGLAIVHSKCITADPFRGTLPLSSPLAFGTLFRENRSTAGTNPPHADCCAKTAKDQSVPGSGPENLNPRFRGLQKSCRFFPNGPLAMALLAPWRFKNSGLRLNSYIAFGVAGRLSNLPLTCRRACATRIGLPLVPRDPVPRIASLRTDPPFLSPPLRGCRPGIRGLLLAQRRRASGDGPGYPGVWAQP